MLPRRCDNKPSSIKDNHPRIHNLDIRRYSINEIYELLGVRRDTATVDDLKRAKQQVLMTHPDKSKLPPDYFIFYKKALEMLITDYSETHLAEESDRRMKEVAQAGKYAYAESEQDAQYRQMTTKIASGDKFMAEFNRVFEEQLRTKPDETKNEWFRDEKDVYQKTVAKSQSDIARAMEEIKQKQQAMILHRGVQSMGQYSGSSYYDGQEEDGSYISGDPFGKLRFEDLRRVHKDETVISVTEKDYSKVPKYKNVDEYNRARSAVFAEPQIDEIESENILRQQELARAQRIQRLRDAENIRRLENEHKQEEIRRMFLQITDDPNQPPYYSRNKYARG